MTLGLSDPRVWLVQDRPTYCPTPPFHASETMPEWPGAPQSSLDNPAYRSVRRLLHDMDLDAGRFGTPDWNPLGDLIRPGQSVVVKPNLVTHFNHGFKDYGLTDTDSLVTHGSVVRAVAEYAARAASPNGKVIISDCPLQGTNWGKLMQLTGLESVAEHLRRAFPTLDVRVVDFRLGTATLHGDRIVARHADESRRADYTLVELGSKSMLEPITSSTIPFGVTQYSHRRMRSAHSPGVHNYLIPNEVLGADVFINVPKMKTHMKTGVTCALKNLVGINGHKDHLPHFRQGSPKAGGDEYPDGDWWWNLTWGVMHREWELEGGYRKTVLSQLARVCRKASPVMGSAPSLHYELGGGSWHGNQTAWRMCLDLNRALFYYDRQSASVSQTPYGPLTYLAIVDGLVAGEGAAPLSPRPVSAGVMFASFNPVATDMVATALMGFDPARVPLIDRAFELDTLPLTGFPRDAVRIVAGAEAHEVLSFADALGIPRFEPWLGFKGKIERDPGTLRSPRLWNCPPVSTNEWGSR